MSIWAWGFLSLLAYTLRGIVKTKRSGAIVPLFILAANFSVTRILLTSGHDHALGWLALDVATIFLFLLFYSELSVLCALAFFLLQIFDGFALSMGIYYGSDLDAVAYEIVGVACMAILLGAGDGLFGRRRFNLGDYDHSGYFDFHPHRVQRFKS